MESFIWLVIFIYILYALINKSEAVKNWHTLIDSNSSGSGFLFSADRKVYLVSAKHVFFKEDGSLFSKTIQATCQNKDALDDNIAIVEIDLSIDPPLYSKNSDIAAIYLGEMIGENNNFIVNFRNNVKIISETKIPLVIVDGKTNTQRINKVSISNDVFVYGYPTSLGLKIKQQFDYNKPLLRKGIIAGIDKKKGTIILDCPVYYGNSGGPVVESFINQDGVRNHKVIGLVSQFIPFVQEWINKRDNIVNMELLNSGYSIAVAIDQLFDLLSFNPDK